MLEKVKKKLLLLFVIAPEAFAILVMFCLVELIFQLYILWGNGNPDLSWLFIQFGVGVSVVFFVIRALSFYIKRRSFKD